MVLLLKRDTRSFDYGSYRVEGLGSGRLVGYRQDCEPRLATKSKE